MTVRINKQKINLREKLTEFEDKVNFDEVVRGLGEYTGNVGIGTTNPAFKLEIQGDEPIIMLKDSSNARLAYLGDGSSVGDHAQLALYNALDGTSTPTVLLNAGGSAYFNAGNVGIGTTNPGVKLSINLPADLGIPDLGIVGGSIIDTISGARGLVAGHASGGDYFLQVQRIDNTPTAYDLLLQPNGGNVGIGTTNPVQKLVVESGQADYVAKLINTNASPSGLVIQFTTDIANASNDFIRCAKNSSDIRFRVYSNGTVLANTTEYTSDDRVKHNEQKIVGAIETLGKITPKKYIKTTKMYEADHNFELDEDGNPVDANGEPVEHSIETGVIAQQVLEVPELAFMVSPEGVDEDGNVTSPHGLNYNSLFTYAIAAIQEQQQIIEDLKSRIETLESK